MHQELTIELLCRHVARLENRLQRSSPPQLLIDTTSQAQLDRGMKAMTRMDVKRKAKFAKVCHKLGHSWKPHETALKSNFRVCERCGEIGWEI